MSSTPTSIGSLVPQIEKQRYMSCKVLEDNMEQTTKDIFQKILSDESITNYIKEEYKVWFLERREIFKQEFSVDLITVLYFCMNSLLLEYGEDATAALKAFKKKKRDRQDYALDTIEREYNGKIKGNPLYMQQQADAYFEALAGDSSINSPYKTKQDYIDFLYLTIYEWGKDASRNLCEFKFYNKLKIERRVAFLIIDLHIFILNYIVNKNAGNFDLSVVSFPTSLIERGVFGFKNQSYDTEVNFSDNGTVQNTIPYDFEENGNTTMNRTIINEVSADEIGLFSEPSKELLELLKDKYGFVENTRGLNNFSFHIVGSVYSLLNPTTLSQDWIYFEDGKAFVRSILQKTKITKKDCLKVREELIKLQNTKMNTKKYDSNGNLLEEVYYQFFETKFTYGEEQIDEEQYRKTIFSDEQDKGEDDPIADYDFINKKWSISIAPSVYLKDEWKNQKNTDIYSKIYKLSVSNKVSKVVTAVFQQLRLEHLESLVASVDYSYLRNHLKGNGMKLSIFKKDLEKELLNLKNSNIIIKNYEFCRTYLYVEFLPLSDIEKEVYGFRKSVFQNIID